MPRAQGARTAEARKPSSFANDRYESFNFRRLVTGFDRETTTSFFRVKRVASAGGTMNVTTQLVNQATKKVKAVLDLLPRWFSPTDSDTILGALKRGKSLIVRGTLDDTETRSLHAVSAWLAP